MARKAVMDAVAARLVGWDRCPVRGLNAQDGLTPKDGGAFLVAQYPLANERQITFGAPGSNIWRETGAIRLVLNVRKKIGIEEPAAWADELAALFRGKTFDGVRTFAPSSPAIDDRNEEGTYFTLSIAVPYEHDLLG